MSIDGTIIIIIAGLTIIAMFPVKWFIKNATIVCAAAAFVIMLDTFFSTNDYKIWSFIAVIGSANND